jgi:hypothetical protein
MNSRFGSPEIGLRIAEAKDEALYFRSGCCAASCVDLHDLTIVHVRPESLLYRFHLGIKSIGRNLDPISHPAGHVLNEGIRRNVIPLPAEERWD